MKTLFLPALLLLFVYANADVTGQVRFASGREAGHAAVYLEGVEHSTPLKNAIVDQRDRKFSPHVLVVTKGTTVSFPNHDTIFHNVFTEYHNARFDFGMYAKGKTKFWTFDRVGVAVLLCSVHPDMSAYVVVVDTPYYTVADGRGRFTIAGVKPGKYLVHVWTESGETYQADATLDASSRLDLKTKR